MPFPLYIDQDTNARGMFLVDPTTGLAVGSAAAPIVTTSGTGASSNQVQGDRADRTADGGNSVKVGGVYDNGAANLTSGQRAPLRLTTAAALHVAPGSVITAADSYGNNQFAGIAAISGGAFATLSGGYVFNGTNWDRARGDVNGIYALNTPGTSAANALSRVLTTAAASALVVKASPGNLYGYSVTSGASAGYLMIFDAITAPTDGTVTPVIVRAIAANATFETDRDIAIRFTVGITMVFSTTGPFTKTASATAFLAGDAK